MAAISRKAKAATKGIFLTPNIFVKELFQPKRACTAPLKGVNPDQRSGKIALSFDSQPHSAQEFGQSLKIVKVQMPREIISAPSAARSN
ncbi:hypothetical protein BBJ66_27170 [Rhizobium sp. RSm-3]|nr:hypothetical protein BBJ66_27170 [Rhizobium sp. RSm-3]